VRRLRSTSFGCGLSSSSGVSLTYVTVHQSRLIFLYQTFWQFWQLSLVFCSSFILLRSFYDIWYRPVRWLRTRALYVVPRLAAVCLVLTAFRWHMWQCTKVDWFFCRSSDQQVGISFRDVCLWCKLCEYILVKGCSGSFREGDMIARPHVAQVSYLFSRWSKGSPCKQPSVCFAIIW
jgi:hypothetical protein